MYNYCLKLTGNQHQAEDLYQDTWEKVIKYQEQYRDDYAFEHWLLRICTNAYRDSYRRKQLMKKIFQFFTDSDTQDFVVESVAESAPGPDEYLIKNVERETLKVFISQLPDSYRIPLILYYYNEYSYREIATLLEIKEGTIKSRLSVAKEKLRERMEAYEQGRI